MVWSMIELHGYTVVPNPSTSIQGPPLDPGCHNDK